MLNLFSELVTRVWRLIGTKRAKTFGHLLPNSITINLASRRPLNSEMQKKMHTGTALQKDISQIAWGDLLRSHLFLREHYDYWLSSMPQSSADLDAPGDQIWQILSSLFRIYKDRTGANPVLLQAVPEERDARGQLQASDELSFSFQQGNHSGYGKNSWTLAFTEETKIISWCHIWKTLNWLPRLVQHITRRWPTFIC